MPAIKLSDTEVLEIIRHLNNLEMTKNLAGKLQQAINNQGKEKAPALSGGHMLDLLEALRSQLSVSQWDQMPSALANLKQRLANSTQAHDTLYRIASAMQLEGDLTFDGIFDEVLRIYREGNAGMSTVSIAANRIAEMERDLKDSENNNEYLRASLKQIEEALGLSLGYTAAHLVEQVGIRVKSLEILEKVEAFLTDSNSLYPADHTAASHQARWRMASELLCIIKGKSVVCVPAQKLPWFSTAQKVAAQPHVSAQYLEAKIIELEAKLAQAESVVQDVRNDVNQPHQHYEIIVKDVMEALK